MVKFQTAWGRCAAGGIVQVDVQRVGALRGGFAAAGHGDAALAGVAPASGEVQVAAGGFGGVAVGAAEDGVVPEVRGGWCRW